MSLFLNSAPLRTLSDSNTQGSQDYPVYSSPWSRFEQSLVIFQIDKSMPAFGSMNWDILYICILEKNVQT